MTKSNGIKSLKQAAKLLNRHAPDGESLAYINPTEARILKAHGGSGIMTLSGVPSYDWWNPFSWDWTGEGGVIDKVTDIWQDKPVLDQAGKVILDSKGRQVIDKGRSIVGDALSVWAALKAKKDKEGLNAAEMEQFNKLNQMHDFAETQFATNVGQGPQVTNVPTTIEDVSVFKEATGIPTMKTTAVAEGGRIGYKDAGITKLASHEGNDAFLEQRYEYYLEQGFSPRKAAEQAHKDLMEGNYQDVAQGGRIGYNMGGIDTPFQGIGALNPRMGYQVGSSDIPGIPGVGKAMRDVEFPTFSEGVNQEFPSNELGAIDTTVQEDVSTIGGNQIQETAMTLVNSGLVANTEEALHGAHVLNSVEAQFPGITNIALQLIEGGQARDIHDAMRQAITLIEGSKQIKSNVGSMDFSEFIPTKAQGGRIGAQKGGIMPLLNMGGMEKDYRQDGGFVPIGRREKADDVPARLSKNEFVFTADAVRAAGGGDIDQGAQRMYNVMKNLEAGGEISEQSQGQG